MRSGYDVVDSDRPKLSLEKRCSILQREKVFVSLTLGSTGSREERMFV